MVPTHPTSEQQRLGILDSLRGFAILGIFCINMVVVGWHTTTEASEKIIWFGKLEDVVVMLLDTLVEGKFYSIFSLLFGIGFGMYLNRQSVSTIEMLPIFKRRLRALLWIGIAHSLLLWIGDILFLYAWLGFVLVYFRHKSDKWLLKAALICLLLPVLFYPLRFIHPYVSLGTPIYAISLLVGPLLGYENIMELNFIEAQLSTSWSDFFKMNILGFIFRQGDLFDQLRPFKVFAMFLLGYWASRQQWHQNPSLFIKKFKSWIPIALPIFILVNFGMAYIKWDKYYEGHWTGWLKTLFYAIGVVPLSLCYVYLFSKAYQMWHIKIFDYFSKVGRMALSNYIFHSVVYLVLMRGVFLGLLGKLSPVACLMVVGLVFPLQILFSSWWLSRFRFGPLEWLWRSLTYRRLQPLKKNATRE